MVSTRAITDAQPTRGIPVTTILLSAVVALLAYWRHVLWFGLPFIAVAILALSGAYAEGVGSWVMLPLAVPVAYIFVCFALVLPAIATDAVPSFGRAWELSRGNGLRLLVTVGLLPVALNLLISGWRLRIVLAYPGSVLDRPQHIAAR